MMVDIDQMILPTPGQSFEWRTTPSGPGLVCRALEPYAVHLFTTRHWALGAPGASIDESSAWCQVASAVDLEPGMLVRPRQVHGNAVVVASPDRNLAVADIVVNDDATVGVAVQVADCVPLVLADRTSGAVAIAHAGWRGLAKRVPEVVVGALSRTFGSRASDLIVACGPSIGTCCYEVGSDVREAFAAAGFSSAELDGWFLDAPMPSTANPSMKGLTRKGRPGHWFFDGWASTREQLVRAGVQAEQIFGAELCTASHPEVLCSYRRDGSPAGRIAAVVRSRTLASRPR